MNKVKIKIENLYKIFGSNAKELTQVVKDGLDKEELLAKYNHVLGLCLLYTSPSPRDGLLSRMPSSA